MNSRPNFHRCGFAGALAILSAVALSACSSGGSSDAESGAQPAEADDTQVVVVANNEFRQTVTLWYKFATGQPRRAGTVSARRTKEIQLRPLTGDLVFVVGFSDGSEKESNPMQVRAGERYQLLIRDNFRPQLIRMN